jgi:hypothetical protein
MTTITQLRDPAELASDIAALSSVDWPVLWRGYEALPDSELRDWCAQFGWRLESIDRVLDLSVSLPTGGKLDLYQVPSPHGPNRIGELSQTNWQAQAATIDENPLAIDQAASIWPEYLSAARGVLGAPAWSGTWEDPEFPKSERWAPRDDRLVDRQPYRLAVWTTDTAGGPVIELWVNLMHGMVSNQGTGSASVRLALHAPEQSHDGTETP